jgi:hypothetical protein
MGSKLLLIAVLTLSSVGAFSQEVPNAPSTASSFPQAEVIPATLGNGRRASEPPVAAKGPWIDPYVADDAYWSYTFALLGSTILNVEMTARCSERGTCLTWFAAGAASGSTRAELYTFTLPTDAAISYFAYRLKSRKSRWWVLAPALATAANLFSAGRSYGRIQLSKDSGK